MKCKICCGLPNLWNVFPFVPSSSTEYLKKHSNEGSSASYSSGTNSIWKSMLPSVWMDLASLKILFYVHKMWCYTIIMIMMPDIKRLMKSRRILSHRTICYKILPHRSFQLQLLEIVKNQCRASNRTLDCGSDCSHFLVRSLQLGSDEFHICQKSCECSNRKF